MEILQLGQKGPSGRGTLSIGLRDEIRIRAATGQLHFAKYAGLCCLFYIKISIATGWVKRLFCLERGWGVVWVAPCKS
jgi:hypothetical protein